MGNPLLNFSARPWSRRSSGTARRRVVPVPAGGPSTDAIFLVLRRMRAPLVLLVAIFAVATFGLAAMPGRDADGNPVRMSVFDAFYVVSYTATTIGYGEIPYPFTPEQRMWVTLTIYLTVIGWAYAIGTLLTLLQDSAFQEALATQRFRGKVRALKEPFIIVCGFGQAGKRVARELDAVGHRFVVVDKDETRLQAIVGSERFSSDVPALEGDASNPAILGLAGLGHPRCAGVLALTSDDDVNLAVVMAGNLLRPEVPVVARCQDRDSEVWMHDFGAEAVVNPNDRFGAYLVLGIQRPVTARLVRWLMSPAGTPLPPAEHRDARGRWVVCGTGEFGDEVAADLRKAGMEVEHVDPADGIPDVSGAAGFVAGTIHDTHNLALAQHARVLEPDIVLAVRQKSPAKEALVDALDVDSVFVPTDLVARESLARIITPAFRSFVDHALTQDDEWSQAVLDRVVTACGPETPARDRVVIDRTDAPAVVRWLDHGALTLGELLSHPDDRTERIGLVPLVLLRDGTRQWLPGDDVGLAPGDELLLAGTSGALADLTEVLYYDATTEYLATGRQVPSTWVARVLTGHLGSRRRRADATDPAKPSPPRSPRP